MIRSCCPKLQAVPSTEWCIRCTVSRAAMDVEGNWHFTRREYYSLSGSNNSKQMYCTFITVKHLAFFLSESCQLPHWLLFFSSLFQSTTIISFNTIPLFRSNFLFVLLQSRGMFALLALIYRVLLLRLIIRIKTIFVNF